MHNSAPKRQQPHQYLNHSLDGERSLAIIVLRGFYRVLNWQEQEADDEKKIKHYPCGSVGEPDAGRALRRAHVFSPYMVGRLTIGSLQAFFLDIGWSTIAGFGKGRPQMDDASLSKIIMNGFPPVMPGFGDTFTTDQVNDLINAIQSWEE